MFFISCEEDNETNMKITDIDGNEYETIQIADQIWMAENLRTTKFNDGTPIILVTDNTEWSELESPAYCWNNNDEATYGERYGAYYNWYVVNTGKLCPAGWHVSTDADWIELERSLGMTHGDAISFGRRGTNEGSKIAGDTYYTNWKDGDLKNNSEFGSSGFNAVPSGFRGTYGGFGNVGDVANWWTSAEYDTSKVIKRLIFYYLPYIDRYMENKHLGYSVRCVKN